MADTKHDLEWYVKMLEAKRQEVDSLREELRLCADAFEACSRGGYACGCGAAAKNVRAMLAKPPSEPEK